jgi:hypothetical protein
VETNISEEHVVSVLRVAVISAHKMEAACFSKTISTYKKTTLCQHPVSVHFTSYTFVSFLLYCVKENDPLYVIMYTHTKHIASISAAV